MKGTHNFSEETRELFFWNRECWFCQSEQWNALHHILGRVSTSPLNAAPIQNFECHIGNGDLDSDEIKKKFLRKTLTYLLSNGYKLTKNDKEFIKKNIRYYLD
jgi:hypothetical protein